MTAIVPRKERLKIPKLLRTKSAEKWKSARPPYIREDIQQRSVGMMKAIVGDLIQAVLQLLAKGLMMTIIPVLVVLALILAITCELLTKISQLWLGAMTLAIFRNIRESWTFRKRRSLH